MTYLKASANNRPLEFEMETGKTVNVEDPDVSDSDDEDEYE